jgi:deazaflavin-dependent oxidoreductase (nitroreductase family)
MSSTPVRPSHGVPAIVPLLNPLVHRLLGAGMPFGPNVLLTVRGRTSGIDRTFPVAVIRHDGRRFVQSPFGEVQWVRNLRASGYAVITKGRRREEVTAVELRPEEAAPILSAAVAPYARSRLLRPLLGRFFNLSAASSPGQALEEAGRHPLFELRPRSGPAGG